MKKLLLASTALVATAGFAAADVNLSGSAEMGVKRSAGSDITEFHTDIGVNFKLSGETDNGIGFGGSIDLEDTAGISTDWTDSSSADYTVFVSAGGAKLTMGDTDGAFDKALTEVGIGAAIADDHTSHAGYSGNGGLFGLTGSVDSDFGSGFDGGFDGQIARFDYAVSGLTFSLSAEMQDIEDIFVFADLNGNGVQDTGEPGDTLDGGETIWGVGVAYTAELAGLDLGVGLGYQTNEDIGAVTGISLSTSFDNGLQAILNYSVTDFDGDLADDLGIDGDELTHTAIGLGYSAGALTISVNYGVFDFEGDEAKGSGLAINYDLGGGLEAQFGASSSEVDGEDDVDSFSLGLAMSF